MRVKNFFLLIGLLFFGEILAIALPGHHPPATPTEVAELSVTIRGVGRSHDRRAPSRSRGGPGWLTVVQ
jgi:hypothetical protein